MRANRMMWMTAVVGFVASAAGGQMVSVVNSPHDLSATGPGAVRAATEQQVCIFCHAPHNASPIAALWNRSQSTQAYTVYTSRALDAVPGQPTGASKLCLSCHDGTIALGAVVSRATPIQMAGGVTTMPVGASNIGTDLRDDHPISFRFDSALATRDGRLRDPSGLPHEIKLDANREMQCTTCHDAHNNVFGKFLVVRNASSELCISCHSMGTTDVSGHSSCTSCHQSHTAPSGPYLLKRTTISQTCLSCHDGSVVGAFNVAADVRKSATHDANAPVDPSGALADQLSCASCHEPHTMMRGVGATTPQLTGPRRTAFGRLGRIAGVNESGSLLTPATAEHEVCLKCHTDGTLVSGTIPRQSVQPSMRQQFANSAVSFHPVGSRGRSSEVPSLKAGWNTASTMECSDCHSSDTGSSSGAHGSVNPGLLVTRQTTADRSSESASAYGLCYRCHDRTSILGDQSFSGHRKHIVEERTPCTVCHDSHGIASATGTPTANSHLINFQTSVVSPSRTNGRLEYRDTGSFRGECFLNCHNQEHEPKTYRPN